jgi:tetratricopeptide (TPR) repeat protein
VGGRCPLCVRLCAALAVLTAALAVAARQPVAAAPQPGGTAAELIVSYADWIQGQRLGVALIAVDLDAARRDLGHLDPSTIPVPSQSSPGATRELQRRYLTAFALELAAAGAQKHAAAAARLVEWACQYVRSHTPQNDYDRAWQLAALAVLEGGIDSQTLRTHLAHAQPGMAGEPRLVLAQGIAEEQFSAPRELLARGAVAGDVVRVKDTLAHDETERRRAAEGAIARFHEAAAVASLRAEATLRLGHVEYALGRYDDALAAWAVVEPAAGESSLRYLLHVFRGEALEARGRYADAREAYLRALQLSPGAHSATVRLSALLFRHLDEDPSALVDGLLRDDDPQRDPWWAYYAGDWRFWYPRIEAVRGLLK